MDREGVQRSLRRVVSESLEWVNRRVRIGMKGERTQDTGNIHNSTGRRFAYDWQQLLRQSNGCKEIRFKSFAQHFRRHRGDGVWPRASCRNLALLQNARVVNQNIQPAVL